jgi:hypothetical protein
MKKTKTIFRLMSIGLVALSPGLQAQVQSTAGLKLVAIGELKMVFNDAGLINHGQFSPGNSTVIFKGNTPATISGSNAVSFHNLVISKTGQDLSLDNDLNISGHLTLEQGNLQLNSRTLDLGYTGRIEGERNNARITGNPGGVIKAYAVLNSPAAANPGNLGVEISSASSLGETVIIRGHSAQLSAEGQPVIARYYDIKPRFNTNLRATLRFYYLDAELNNGKEDALTFFSSKNDQASWIEAGKDKSDLSTNWVVKNNLDQLHRFTLAGATNKMLAQQNSKTSVQLFPNPTPGQFTILLNSSTDQESAVNLYDQLGRLLESKKVQFRAGVNNIKWNIARYANGTYYLSFGNTDLKTVKIVKE